MKDSKWLYVVLSVFMAILLWGYVIREANPDQTRTITDIPITFSGADVLASRNLILSAGGEQTMDLTVKTKLDIYSKLDRDNITLKVDVSKLVEARDYRVMVDISYPPNVAAGNISLQNDLADLYVDFTVSKLETKEIPVKGEFTGSVAAGYQAGELSVTPGTIGISGQKELVNQVAYAAVRITQENMSETYTGDLSFVYMGMNGEELTDLKLTADVDTVHIVYPIVMVKEVPLTVDILPGGGATAENVKVSIQPKTIDVTGSQADIAALTELNLGAIDLSKVVTVKEFTFPVTLTPELTNESGVKEAIVTVTVEGLTTREFEVDDISLANIPAGFQAEAVTQTRLVLVRGSKAAVEAVFGSQLRIVADVSKAPASPGRYTIPAKVYLDGSSDVGVVDDCNIVVTISR
ncbi:MAG: hypothetical protein RR281_00300 [Pseudoflavonifractor sp.]